MRPRPRTLLAGLGVAALGTTLANRALRAGPLAPPLSGASRTYRWRGFDVAYTEAGDPEDPDVLLLHGVHAAGSSHEFRNVVGSFAEDHHVLAPDMPGFGRSDRPPVVYTADHYVAFVADFAADLTAEATCVATSLAGAHAAAAAEWAGFSQLVLVCPTADTADARPWLHRLFRTPLVGTGLFNLLVTRESIRWFDSREGYYGDVPAEVVDYQWRTAHQPGARFAPASFVGGDLDLDVPLASLLSALDVPVTLVWGRESLRPPVAAGRDLADRTGAELAVVERARGLPHDERPTAFLEAIADDLHRLEAA